MVEVMLVTERMQLVANVSLGPVRGCPRAIVYQNRVFHRCAVAQKFDELAEGDIYREIPTYVVNGS